MKKRKNKPSHEPFTLNLVAKHAYKFNKSLTFKDKRKYYRKAKHKASELLLIKCVHFIRRSSKSTQQLYTALYKV